jgi:hypothetical protein
MRIGDPQALQNPAYRLADVDLGRPAEPRRAPAKFLDLGATIESIHLVFQGRAANLFSSRVVAERILFGRSKVDRRRSKSIRHH